MEKSLLQRIQSADAPVKRRWVIGVSASAMIVVLFLWAVYFDTMVKGFSVEGEAREGERGGSAAAGGGESRIAQMYSLLQGTARSLLEAGRKPSSYIIK